jgi:RNA polymerase sigma factor (sigma-70 family)
MSRAGASERSSDRSCPSVPDESAFDEYDEVCLRQIAATILDAWRSCYTRGGMPDDDLILLDRWCAGDTTSGNTLFKRHFASLYRFFENKTEGEVDDLVQETFEQCLKSRATFERRSSFRTYLFAIARHVLFHHWRKRSNQREAIDFDDISMASLTTSVGSRMAKTEDQARLMAALRELPVEQQILLEMYYWENFDRDQLSEIFEVETATIGSRLTRARQALRESLDLPVDASLDALKK